MIAELARVTKISKRRNVAIGFFRNILYYRLFYSVPQLFEFHSVDDDDLVFGLFLSLYCVHVLLIGRAPLDGLRPSHCARFKTVDKNQVVNLFSA